MTCFHYIDWQHLFGNVHREAAFDGVIESVASNGGSVKVFCCVII